MIALPNAKVAKLPNKDANECVMKNNNNAMINALLFKKQDNKKTRLVWIDEYFDKALEPVPYGIPYPWDGLNYLTKGRQAIGGLLPRWARPKLPTI